ncbi:14503_t:CDS:2 [Funneliformis geosporum]|nr:14503_t:CDS:2 [Funneliformis geosporum]
MSATTSIPKSQQPPQKPGFRKIMTWNPKRSSKKAPHLSYDSAPESSRVPLDVLLFEQWVLEGDDKSSPAPASPTPSLRSLKSGRPSLFATFARRNSTKSEHSSRSRSPTSPRQSHDLNFSSDGVRTPPSPTPSRNSMIFERDIEFHDHLSVHEAIDLAIPPVLDDAAEAFVNEEISTTILTEKNGELQEDNGDGKDGESGTGKQESNGEDPRVIPLVENEGRKRLSLINYADVIDHQHTIAETLRVTTPREMNGLTGIFDK